MSGYGGPTDRRVEYVVADQRRPGEPGETDHAYLHRTGGDATLLNGSQVAPQSFAASSTVEVVIHPNRADCQCCSDPRGAHLRRLTRSRRDAGGRSDGRRRSGRQGHWLAPVVGPFPPVSATRCHSGEPSIHDPCCRRPNAGSDQSVHPPAPSSHSCSPALSSSASAAASSAPSAAPSASPSASASPSVPSPVPSVGSVVGSPSDCSSSPL